MRYYVSTEIFVDLLEDSNYFIGDSRYFDLPEDVQRVIFSR